MGDGPQGCKPAVAGKGNEEHVATRGRDSQGRNRIPGKGQTQRCRRIQQKIVDIVRGLEEAGQLQRPGSDGEEEFVA